MELGEKLKQARLEAGLSQRQLCGEEITRNMLSQIEHGTARPSMSTLTYLARELGKPVSWFLEEDASVSSNVSCIAAAWAAYEQQRYDDCSQALKSYLGPDPVCDRQRDLLMALNSLALAERAARQGKTVYVRQLLTVAENLEGELFWLPELKARRIRLRAQIQDAVAAEDLPNLDDDLLLLARTALACEKYEDAARYLEAMEARESGLWNLLRGRAAAGQKQYKEAIPYLQAAEMAYPRETVPLLEEAYRELGDFRNAYLYACKGR